jgi:hypothetical protein
MTFDGTAEEREAGIYLSALVDQYKLAMDSHGAFAREIELEGLELDMFIEREAEGERFVLCGRSSSSALRFILALLSLSWSSKGVEDFPPFSILDDSIASSSRRWKRCRLFGCRRVREGRDTRRQAAKISAVRLVTCASKDANPFRPKTKKGQAK